MSYNQYNTIICRRTRPSLLIWLQEAPNLLDKILKKLKKGSQSKRSFKYTVNSNWISWSDCRSQSLYLNGIKYSKLVSCPNVSSRAWTPRRNSLSNCLPILIPSRRSLKVFIHFLSSHRRISICCLLLVILFQLTRDDMRTRITWISWWRSWNSRNLWLRVALNIICEVPNRLRRLDFLRMTTAAIASWLVPVVSASAASRTTMHTNPLWPVSLSQYPIWNFMDQRVQSPNARALVRFHIWKITDLMITALKRATYRIPLSMRSMRNYNQSPWKRRHYLSWSKKTRRKQSSWKEPPWTREQQQLKEYQ